MLWDCGLCWLRSPFCGCCWYVTVFILTPLCFCWSVWFLLNFSFWLFLLPWDCRFYCDLRSTLVRVLLFCFCCCKMRFLLYCLFFFCRCEVVDSAAIFILILLLWACSFFRCFLFWFYCCGVVVFAVTRLWFCCTFRSACFWWCEIVVFRYALCVVLFLLLWGYGFCCSLRGDGDKFVGHVKWVSECCCFFY